MIPRNPQFEAACRAAFNRQGLMQTFGASISAIAPGLFEIKAPISPAVSQQHGYGHAGLTFAIGDSAAGFAAQTLIGADQSVLTVEMKINLMAPAQGTQLVANGRVLRAGRRVSTVETDVFDDQNRQVARLLGTMMILDG
ncbi:PaaI family thioesterase [Pontivivens insulae]|uniref:Medium/long-chain acyl-CoA thioesterase YigI n=1 Tax=Pontivivens insulae TaxID=1639689 RepID=A0A2R8A8P5_9RHOB|nr:PaaI family thioesterase [Pontivivens insulae]RED18698.1 uncharacterized protein (TIGR00369 family) [Pontivivens insulae]SPF28596.1 1,4-dihydroxy-2-naphthoyl-CoA hydrolase [Pontivivens insulae]